MSNKSPRRNILYYVLSSIMLVGSQIGIIYDRTLWPVYILLSLLSLLNLYIYINPRFVAKSSKDDESLYKCYLFFINLFLITLLNARMCGGETILIITSLSALGLNVIFCIHFLLKNTVLKQ